MTNSPIVPDAWPDDPWARSSRERASLAALKYLGDRLGTALDSGAAELVAHRDRVDEALRRGGIYGMSRATSRARTTARTLRTAQFGAVILATVAAAFAMPAGAAVVVILCLNLLSLRRFVVPDSASMSRGRIYYPAQTDYLWIVGIGILLTLLSASAGWPSLQKPTLEGLVSAIAGSAALALGAARFRHADRVARRLAREEPDEFRRLVAWDAVVLRWDPPARYASSATQRSVTSPTSSST